jgi:hypothetical protein
MKKVVYALCLFLIAESVSAEINLISWQWTKDASAFGYCNVSLVVTSSVYSDGSQYFFPSSASLELRKSEDSSTATQPWYVSVIGSSGTVYAGEENPHSDTYTKYITISGSDTIRVQIYCWFWGVQKDISFTFTRDGAGPTAPTVTANPSGWTRGSVTLTASGSTDAGSGFNRYQYSFDDSNWSDGSSYTLY